MRRSSLFISGLLLLVACGGGGGGGGGGGQPPADEETFYVNPGGSDDNDGLAPDRPFRTLFRAVDGLTAGDVVYVAPGEYPLQPTTPGEPRPTEVAEFRDVLGTAAQPVSLIADITGEKTGTDPGDVVVDGDDAAIGLRVSRSTHIIIDGFRIISARGNNGAGIQVRSGSDDVTVRNCVITDSGDGVRVENSNDALIFNNLIYGNDNRGIRISNGSVRASVINNTIVNNRDRGVAIGGANAQNVAPTGATLRNNLIQNNNNVSISIEQGPPSAVVGYSGNFNLVFYSGLADQTKTVPADDHRRRQRRQPRRRVRRRRRRRSAPAPDEPGDRRGHGQHRRRAAGPALRSRHHRRRRTRRSADRHRLPLPRPNSGGLQPATLAPRMSGGRATHAARQKICSSRSSLTTAPSWRRYSRWASVSNVAGNW
jgi:parallel beta-helix repeat protein